MSQPWLMETGFSVRAPTVTCHGGSGSPVARFTRLALWGERAGGGSKKETSTGIQTLKMDRDGRAPLLVRTPIEMTINDYGPRGGIPMNVKRLIVATVSLSMGLAGVHGSALAQIKDAPLITGNVDGTCVTSPSVNTTGANAGDWTITCGDISPGAGMTVIGPPAVVSGPAPMPAPEPVGRRPTNLRQSRSPHRS